MKIELKVKEQKLLKLICDDYSNDEIAIKLDCGLRHVEKMKTVLYKKTKTHSGIGLLKWAVINKFYKIGKTIGRKRKRNL